MKSGNGGGGGGVVRRSLYTKSIHATAEMCNKRENERERAKEKGATMCKRGGHKRNDIDLTHSSTKE